VRSYFKNQALHGSPGNAGREGIEAKRCKVSLPVRKGKIFGGKEVRTCGTLKKKNKKKHKKEKPNKGKNHKRKRNQKKKKKTTPNHTKKTNKNKKTRGRTWAMPEAAFGRKIV